MIEFVPAELHHGVLILENLREQEKKTIARLNLNAVELMRVTLRKQTPSYTCLIDDEPAAIFGIDSASVVGDTWLWMLTTPLIEKHKIALLKASRNFCKWARDNYGPILGLVDAKNEISLKWMKWIGFEVEERGEYIRMRFN